MIVSHPVKRKKPGMHGLSCYVPWRPRRYAFQFKNLKMQTATGTIIINEMMYDSTTQLGHARSILEDYTLYWHNLVKWLQHFSSSLWCSCSPLKCCFMSHNRILHVIESYHDSPSQVHKYIVSPKSMTQHIKQKVCCIMRHYGPGGDWQELKWTPA